MSKPLAYIILEDFQDSPMNSQVINKNHNGHVMAQAVLQTANERNRNGRFYPKEDLFPQIMAPRTQELINAGYFLGEMGHPLSKDLARQSTIDQTKTCVRYHKLWTEGDNVMGIYSGTNNEFGRTIEQDLLEGYKPAFSLRALGSVENTSRGAEVRQCKLISYDLVIYPSHPGAYTTGLISESASLLNNNDCITEATLIPITNDSVISYIKSESSSIKKLNELFDMVYENISLDKKTNSITMKDKEGHTLIVPLESYITREIYDYCSKF